MSGIDAALAWDWTVARKLLKMTRFDTGAGLQINDESEIQGLLWQTEEPDDERAVAS